MKAAYRRPGILRGCTSFLVLLLGIAAQFLVIYLCRPYEKQLQGWIIPICILPGLGAIVLAMVLVRRVNRGRIQMIGAALEAEGIRPFLDPSAEQRAELAPHVEALKGPFELSYGIEKVVWLGFNDQLFVFEHSFFTGSGRTTVEHVKTVVAWPRGSSARVDSLGDRPWMIAAKVGRLGARRFRKSLGEELKLGDSAFDRKWAIFGNDQTALALFTSSAREQALCTVTGERWSIGGGWVACAAPMALDAQNIVPFIRYAQSVIKG
jgi:hypothetical protein